MKLSDIYRHAAERPCHIAAVNSGTEFTYRRFAGMIEALRCHFGAQPLPRNGLIAVVADSLIYSWALQLALRSLGHTTIRAASRAVLDSLNLRDLSAIVCLEGINARQYGDWATPAGRRFDCVPASVLAQADTISLPDLPNAAIPGDHIVLTSGTTGSYRKVCHESRHFAARLDYELAIDIAYRPDDVIHVAGLGEWSIAGFLTPQRAWSVGATVVFDQREQWIDHFFDHPVTVSILVGPAIAALSESRIRQPAGYPQLQIRTGGGFVAFGALAALRRKFNCRVSASYVGTEFTIALLADCESADDLLWLPPTPGGTLDIVDDDDCPVPADAPGIVRIRLHPWDPAGYHDDAPATAKHYRGQWFYPGDMAVRREDGRTRILGRVQDVLVIAGAKVPVAPHEQRAREILGVNEVCLFARQAENGTVFLLVVVECDALPMADRLQELAALYRRDFDGTKFASASRFPRGANGMAKVNRPALLQLVENRLRCTSGT